MSSPAQKLQSERLKYPGLLPREIIVWRAWLKQHESEYDRFDYNVRLGEGTDPGPGYADDVRKMAIDLSKKRADAIGYKGNTVTLFEVKDRGGFSAVGQLVGYNALWIKSHPGDPPPTLVMVTNRIPADLEHTLKLYNIRLDVVSVDFSELFNSK